MNRQLSEMFTRFGSDDIYQSQVLEGVLGGSSIATDAPLKALIDYYVDFEMMRQLAEQRRRDAFF